MQLGTLEHLLELDVQAVETLQRSLTIWHKLGDTCQTAWTLFQLGVAHSSQGDYGQAEVHLADSLSIYRNLNDRWSIVTLLNQLGNVASSRGDYDTAGCFLDESLSIIRELQGSDGGMVVVLNLRGRILLGKGEVEQAIFCFDEALAISNRRHNREGEAWSWLNLGLAHLEANDLGAAATDFAANLAINKALHRKGGMMAAIEGLAAIAAAQNEFVRAAQLLNEAEQLRVECGQPLTSYEMAMHHRTYATIQMNLGYRRKPSKSGYLFFCGSL